MPSIELPPGTSADGVALAREIAELIGRHFKEQDGESSARPGKEPVERTVGSTVCPKCKTGTVVRINKKDGGSYLACSKRDFQDKTTCQFSVWDADQISDFLAGRPIKFKKYDAKKVKEAPSKTAAVAAPNVAVQDVFEVIDKINSLDPAQRTQILTNLGWDGGSYVLWLSNADADVVAEVAQALR